MYDVAIGMLRMLQNRPVALDRLGALPTVEVRGPSAQAGLGVEDGAIHTSQRTVKLVRTMP